MANLGPVKEASAALAAYRKQDARLLSKEDVEIFDRALMDSVTVVHEGELARKQEGQ